MAQESEELVEAARHRMKFVTESKMPFANQRRPVTSSLKTICDSGFIEREAEINKVWRHIKVELMAEPLLITTC
jgi:hypothetical protein